MSYKNKTNNYMIIRALLFLLSLYFLIGCITAFFYILYPSRKDDVKWEIFVILFFAWPVLIYVYKKQRKRISMYDQA